MTPLFKKDKNTQEETCFRKFGYVVIEPQHTEMSKYPIGYSCKVVLLGPFLKKFYAEN